MSGALLLILEGLIVLTLGIDLSLGFQVLSAAPRLLLILVAAAGAAAAGWPGRTRTGSLKWPILALAAGGIAAGALGLLQEQDARQIERHWPDAAHQRLETRARLIEDDFRGFLGGLSGPLQAVRGAPLDRSAAFAALARVRAASPLPAGRLGLTIYGADLSPLAWDGNSSDAPRAVLAAPCPGPDYFVGGPEASRRLFVSLCSTGGMRLVAEYVLERPLETEAHDASTQLSFVPHSRDAGPVVVRFPDESAGQDDLGVLFRRQGDRHWGQLGGEGVLTLAFPLRAPDGSRLAIVSLRDRRASQAIGDDRRRLRIACGLAIALSILAAWGLALRRGIPRSRTGRLVSGSLVIWAVRSALLVFIEPASLPRTPIYDISVYASGGLGGLLRSPADLLLTAMAFCLQCWIVSLALRSIDLPPGAWRIRLRRAALVGMPLVAAAGMVLLHGWLDRMVLDTRLDISRVDTGDLLTPRVLLQAAVFLAVLGIGLLLRALVDLALRHVSGADDWRLVRRLRGAAAAGIPYALRAAAWMFLLTLAYAPILNHAYDRLRRDFFEDDLKPRVLEQERMRRQALRDSLSLTRYPDFAALAAVADEHPGAAAYRLWRQTPVADLGLASSVRVFDERGLLLARFALDFAPMLEVSFDEARTAAGQGIVAVAPRPNLTVRKPIIFGSSWVGGTRQPLLVVLTASNDYDDLTILGGDTLGAGLFRSPAPARSNPELLRSEPLVAAFSDTLSTLYDSGGEIPPPSTALLAAVESEGQAWTGDDLRGGGARVLYFRGPREVFALAYVHPSRTGVLAGYLRLYLLNAFLALLAAGFGRAVLWVAHPTRLHLSLGRTYSRRLVTVFLLAGLGPLLALAYLATRSTTREIDQDISTTGLASLQVVRRVAEDYLTIARRQQGGSLDDNVVYWLSRVVRQDINVYRDATLVATSTRELYGSGLLNERLDGAAYRAIFLEREPFFLAEQRTGDLDFLALVAPMHIDRQGTLGAISLPLIEHSRLAAHREEEIEDAVLIVTCFTILLLAIVGNVLAQRVSRPVASLARAARLVAAGDLAVRVPVTGTRTDETGLMVDAFNRMADSLQRQRDDLRRRTDYIEKILRSATTGVVSIDGAGTIITINPAAQTLLAPGRPGPEIGDDLQAGLARDPAHAPLLAALRRAREGRIERELEVELAQRPGEERSFPGVDGPRRVRAVFLPFTPEEGVPQGLIVLLEDVTEIVRSGRLAAWAEMARRVAHEIKNPLTPIQLSVDHVRRVFKAGDARFETVLRECLDNIQRQVGVLREIAFEFSAYARLPRLRPETVAVAALLDEALRPYIAASPPGITIRRSVPPDLPPVRVDRAVMVRALVNLIENALQAMPSGGSLDAGAGPAAGPGGAACVAITLRDTGHGIPDEVMPHLFEPYFSTRSGGTGLGLGLVRRTIEEHGGSVAVRSRAGAGTVVTLTLPAAPLEPAGPSGERAGRREGA